MIEKTHHLETVEDWIAYLKANPDVDLSRDQQEQIFRLCCAAERASTKEERKGILRSDVLLVLSLQLNKEN